MTIDVTIDTALNEELIILRQRVRELEQLLVEYRPVTSELRRLQQKVTFHIEQTPLAYIEWDLSFTVVEWNTSAERVFGFSRSEALGRHAAGLIVPAHAKEHVDRVWQGLLAQQGGVRSTNDNITKDGGIITCEWYNTPLIDDDGQVYGVASLVQNINEQKLAKESLARLAAIIEATPDLVGIADLQGYALLMNRAGRQMFGLSPEQDITNVQISENHPEWATKIVLEQGIPAALEHGVWHGETALRGRDGRKIPVSQVILAHKDPNGNVEYLSTIARDISEQKRLEVALRDSEQRLRTIIGNVPAIVYSIDREGLFTLSEGKGLAALGLQPGQLVGTSAFEVYADVPQVVNDLRRALSGETFTSIAEMSNGVYESWYTPLRNDTGEIIGLTGVSTDVTERKRAEEEQRRLQEEIIQVQAQTLAEISTPLIPINDQVVVMPLIGTMDSRRVQQMQETLLHNLAVLHARIAILDLTGVPVVDTQVANALIQAAQAVKLLGAEVILTGIRPELAQTLVGLGVDLRSIITRSSLQSGIAYAMDGR